MEIRNELKDMYQLLIESMADFLDTDGVIIEQSYYKHSDPAKREETELHIRMANAAMKEYEKTVFGIKETTSDFLIGLGFVKEFDFYIKTFESMSININFIENICSIDNNGNISNYEEVEIPFPKTEQSVIDLIKQLTF